MATQLFNGEHSQMFPARRVRGMLEAGWTTTPQKAKKEISDEEKELRDKAKELGISHYWTKRS